jgi:hypothetical protein
MTAAHTLRSNSSMKAIIRSNTTMNSSIIADMPTISSQKAFGQ